MKVTVNKYLNVRVGKPSVNAPCYQYLAPGSELEVDGRLYPGETYKDINTWLKDGAGNYYWSGGVDQTVLTSKILTSANWWMTNFRIPEAWAMGLSGKGIKIAILDTGVFYPHPALNLDAQLFKDVTNSPSGSMDVNGHGTHCAGIIKGYSSDRGQLGVAINSVIYVCKITHDEIGDINAYLVDGIKWATSNGVDIISISKGDPQDDPDVDEELQKAFQAGILIVAAAGNKIAGYPDDHIYYPARNPVTLSVGGVDDTKIPLTDSILTGETNLFAPGKQILSTYLNSGYLNLSGSSQATPFVAGACALLLEFARKTKPDYKAVELKKFLLNNPKPFPSINCLDIVNTINLINHV